MGNTNTQNQSIIHVPQEKASLRWDGKRFFWQEEKKVPVNVSIWELNGKIMSLHYGTEPLNDNPVATYVIKSKENLYYTFKERNNDIFSEAKENEADNPHGNILKRYLITFHDSTQREVYVLYPPSCGCRCV
jgi:hypothetical protein